MGNCFIYSNLVLIEIGKWEKLLREAGLAFSADTTALRKRYMEKPITPMERA
jgi:hypothetical protein